jgi:hypothetical protein
MKTSAEADRPQVRTRDGFVLRRTRGYNIYLTRPNYLSFASLLSEFEAGRKHFLARIERCNFLANHLRYET